MKEWSAPPDSENYQSAPTLQKDLSIPLRTEMEQESEPYSDNLLFYCHYQYRPGYAAGTREWRDEWGGRGKTEGLPLSPCKILSRELDDTDASGSAYNYTVVMLDKDELEGLRDVALEGTSYPIPSGSKHIMNNVPRWAISVRDKLYSKDEFLANAFRHEMMMPDEIFPEAWKNIRK